LHKKILDIPRWRSSKNEVRKGEDDPELDRAKPARGRFTNSVTAVIDDHYKNFRERGGGSKERKKKRQEGQAVATHGPLWVP